MHLPFSLFLALKYLKPKRTFISLISLISMIGIALGVAVLIIVTAVMAGFDDMWREKILNFNAHVTLFFADGYVDDYEDVLKAVKEVPGVAGAAPHIQGLVFLQHSGLFNTPVLCGVDPELEKQVSLTSDHMVAGTFEMELEDVVLGQDLAQRLGVAVGNQILVYSPQNFVGGKGEISLPLELNVAGIFNVGMWEYDSSVVFTALNTARDLTGLERGVHELRVMVDNPYKARAVAEDIILRLSPSFPELRYQTWMDLNRQLFNALRVEKNMMFFLLIFIVLVAAFGLTNTLIVEVFQKTKEIGLLKALGFPSASIMAVFFWQGWIQGLVGTAGGIVFGLGVLHFRNTIMQGMNSLLGIELLPKELYHLSEIPAHVKYLDLGLVAILSLIICTLAGLIPAWRAAKLDPASALRHE